MPTCRLIIQLKSACRFADRIGLDQAENTADCTASAMMLRTSGQWRQCASSASPVPVPCGWRVSSAAAGVLHIYLNPRWKRVTQPGFLFFFEPYLHIRQNLNWRLWEETLNMKINHNSVLIVTITVQCLLICADAAAVAVSEDENSALAVSKTI